MTKTEAMALLPKVGDILKESPTIIIATAHTSPKRSCVVVEVNPQGLWYRVRFKRTGFYECYKVPRLKPIQTGGVPW